jgi:CRISPR-associated endonuclease Csn1
MKKILGIDIGSNSVGWAYVNLDFENEQGNIIDMGSRIIPMDADLLKNFEQGNTISRTAGRRNARGARRRKQRYKLRRERLVKAMKMLGWVPEAFPEKFEGIHEHNINQFLPFSPEAVEECAKLLSTDPETMPHDWVIYYLRKKALYEKIEIRELARILYHLNQRRGFKSNRKANDESTLSLDEMESANEKPANEKRIEILKIVGIEDTGEISRGKKVFQVVANKEIADGLNHGTLLRVNKPEWVNTEQELEVRIKRSRQGTRIELAMPDKSEWKKMKEGLEKDIEESDLRAGEYFFDQLRKDPNYRIKQRVIDRRFFIDELKQIWESQARFHNELTQNTQLAAIANELYKHNAQKQKELASNDLLHLFLNDIIYYQRPLKSQRASVGNCRFEKKNTSFAVKNNREIQPALKAAPASSPLFQEFRIWKTIHNLKVMAIQKMIDGKLQTDVDETATFLTPEKKAELFRKFDESEQIKPPAILRLLGLSPNDYKLNYPEDTTLPGNETKHFFRKAFKKLGYPQGETLLESPEQFNELWHLFYSVEEPGAIAGSLEKRFGLPAEIAAKMSNLPPFPSRYAVFSQKALAKLLQVMRTGPYWSYERINPKIKDRIQKIINAEDDPEVNLQTREMLKHLNREEHFQGLPEWMATYVVYGKHSEREGEPVENPAAIKVPEQNSLRNPIVEQVINETMQLTKAIWEKYGRPDEIRVEMARDMNRSAKEREKVSKNRDKNRDDKLRIKAILRELKLGNPESLADIEKLRLLEENGNYQGENYNEKFFRKPTEPTMAEIQRYRLWVEQKCVSPYTGRPISLSRLFTREYEVEHIIPRARFFDDSLGNKVIVETWANDEKGNQTAMKYIRTGSARGNILSVDDYVAHINKTFYGKKRKHLLSDEVPESFIERQLNDTRYISKVVTQYLSQIVPQNKVRITMGEITNELKQKWGLNELMKKLLIPRFERLEEITGESYITYETNNNGQRKVHLKGYEKRIDHRHHALDALIVACTTNSHVQYLNTLSGKNDRTAEFKFKKLMNTAKTRDFRLPWRSFIPDARQAMERIIVSHKNRNRILNKGVNRYLKYVFENGKWIKKPVMQQSDELYSIRKPLHKETITGTIQLRKYKTVSLSDAIKNVERVADKRIKNSLKQLIAETGGNISRIRKELSEHPLLDKHGQAAGNRITIWYYEKYAVSREALNDSFTESKIREKVAEYDTPKAKGLKHLLLSHLAEFDNDPKTAFTGEGLESLWKKAGHPITKVSTYEPIGKKFEIRPNQLVEAAKGTNLFFVIYENLETGEREYETLGFNEVIAARINKLPLVKPKPGYRHFTLSPNDLVYVPEPDENAQLIDWQNDIMRIAQRIYRMVSSTGKECHFLPHNISKSILPKIEFGSLNKSERDSQGSIIKSICIKVKHDRLGGLNPL